MLASSHRVYGYWSDCVLFTERKPVLKCRRAEHGSICCLARSVTLNVPWVEISTGYYVQIKCQLDATDDIYCRSLLLAQHVSGNTMPIIRRSRVLYRWSLPVVFGALVFRLWVWCGAEGYVSGLQAAALLPVKQQPANRTRNLQLHTIPTTWKPKHQIPQAATICIILSSSWWWA